jgi:hypothetical protein
MRKLEILIAERNERIDALSYANQKLHLENDCLTALLIAQRRPKPDSPETERLAQMKRMKHAA